jgi:aryl-alcohol dehydrogenase-like predicted oxidoreductase
MSSFTRRKLGKTGLEVSPIGIGGGNGISNEDLLYAFDRGINYFFFSSDLHHFSYRKSAEAIKTLCGGKSAVRDQVVLATVTYMSNPEKLIGAVIDQISELQVDYIDVFHWGWITEKEDFGSLVEATRQLKAGGQLSRMVRLMMYQASEINQELLNRGLVRYVGSSFHARKVACEWRNELDVLMLRYNLAHLGVEQEVFPYLYGDKEKDPGIVVFNVAHEGRLLFNVAPPGYPKNLYVPTIPDCYRFALSNTAVDLVLTGVTTRAELDQALDAMEKGPLSEDECAFLREYGSIYSRRIKGL